MNFSFGKSTLAEKCISHLTLYSFTRIQEVARTVLNRLNLTGKDLLEYINENNLENVQEKEKNYLSDRAEQIGYTECLKYWYEQAHLPYFVINDLDLAKRVEFLQQHINGNYCWLPPEFPIPLCLPFHLDKPKHNEQLFLRFIEILDKQNIHKVLSNSIYINGEEYHFVGDDDNGNS